MFYHIYYITIFFLVNEWLIDTLYSGNYLVIPGHARQTKLGRIFVTQYTP